MFQSCKIIAFRRYKCGSAAFAIVDRADEARNLPVYKITVRKVGEGVGEITVCQVSEGGHGRALIKQGLKG